MPWCIHHPEVQVVTDFRGVATCDRCEAERRAEFDRRCRICLAPVARPGLCPSCSATNAWRERTESVGRHAMAIVLLVIVVALWVSWASLFGFICDAAYVGSGRDACFTADPPPDCTAFQRACSATARERRDAEGPATGRVPRP